MAETEITQLDSKLQVLQYTAANSTTTNNNTTADIYRNNSNDNNTTHNNTHALRSPNQNPKNNSGSGHASPRSPTTADNNSVIVELINDKQQLEEEILRLRTLSFDLRNENESFKTLIQPTRRPDADPRTTNTTTNTTTNKGSSNTKYKRNSISISDKIRPSSHSIGIDGLALASTDLHFSTSRISGTCSYRSV